VCKNSATPPPACQVLTDGSPSQPFGHVQNSPDLITAKLPALHLYQLSIPAPAPPSSSFDHTAADRGRELFSGKAQCSTCHSDPVFTEPGWNMHKASDVCVDDFQANRAPDHAYRTTPLNGLWTHTKGGFYHLTYAHFGDLTPA
jgi:cytochrome c peroxidase